MKTSGKLHYLKKKNHMLEPLVSRICAYVRNTFTLMEGKDVFKPQLKPCNKSDEDTSVTI